MNPGESERALLVFEGFDENGDGVISKGELFSALKSLGVVGDRTDLEVLFESLDLDKNGVIDFQEFMRLFYMMSLNNGECGMGGN